MAGIEKINSVSSNNYQKKPVLTAKNTGYTALTGLGLTTASAAFHSTRKFHKPLAVITILATLLHLGLILQYKHRMQKMDKTTE